MNENLTKCDISDELYREYVMTDYERAVVYRIDNPVTLYYRNGGSTHRIVDSTGLVHCLPGPGYRGAALRWMPRDNNNPVAF